MHKGRSSNLPAVAQALNHVIGFHHRICKKDLVERGVVIHLPQGLHVHGILGHINQEIGQPLMLGHVPIRARQQQSPFGMMGRCGPNFLTIDDPLIFLEIRPRRGSSQIGTAARFAEQLAPSILTGQNAAQEFFLMHPRTVIQQGCRRQHADAGSGHANCAHGSELFLHGTGEFAG